jgi:hypothetical protein
MSAHKKTAKLVCALLLAASSTVALSGAAQAETTGWTWFDSVFSTPAPVPPPARVQSAPVIQTAPVKRTRVARPAVIAPAPAPIQVSAVSSSNSDCFWCNRRVYISGLSF